MKAKVIFACIVCLFMILPMVTAQVQETQPSTPQQKTQHQTIHISVSNPMESFCYTQPPIPIMNDKGEQTGYLSIEVGGKPGEPLGYVTRTYLRWIKVIVLGNDYTPQVWEKTSGIFSWIYPLYCFIIPSITQGTYRPLVWHCDGTNYETHEGLYVVLAWLYGHGYYYNNQNQDGLAESIIVVSIFGDTMYDYYWEGPGWLDI
jgi:hypothetical protein